MKRTAILVSFLVFLLTVSAAAEITREDQILLNLMFRNRVVSYLEGEEADARVREIADAAGGNRSGGQGDPTERFRMLAEGLSIMTYGEWNEAREVAALLDMRIPAKIYETGDTIEVAVSPLWPREGRFKQHYMVHVELRNEAGETVGEGAQLHLHEPASKVVSLAIPADAARGLYRVHYAVEAHRADDRGVLLEADRTLFVLPSLRHRLAELEAKLAKVQGLESKGRRYELTVQAIEWHLSTYRQAMQTYVAGAYTNHPIFMTASLSGSGLVIERLDFLAELEQAEELASALLAGKDPLRTRAGDLRLAYISPADFELVPFRIYVPEGFDPSQTYPLVVGLHGAGGDENSFMDRYQGLFKKNAQQRGYIAVSVNGRGPYGGYRGDSGQDVLDVIQVVQEAYPIDARRIYLTGHSMGGGGTVLLGFDHAERFAALAPIAGFGSAAQLAKAPKMPLLIAQGEADALVPVESARRFHEAAKEAGLEVQYIEKAGVDHIAIVDLVMDAVFDWFDAH